MENSVLSICDLAVDLTIGREKARVLHEVSLTVTGGEILGLVGESGSGKSITAAAIMQLLPGGKAAITGGSISFRGQELTRKTPAEMRKIRGKEMAMIFQEPMTSLNPVFTIGRQLTDVIMTHQDMSKRQAEAHATAMLEAVHIREPERILRSYPHELSGGMRQRVMIAIALSCSPALLIADEPTTALDVTIQAQILRLLQEAVKQTGAAVIFISHDLGVVSQICDRVAVMYAGEVVECGGTAQLLHTPRHPYTQALLAAIPDFSTMAGQLSAIPGTVPDVRSILPGCRFQPRCSCTQDICTGKKPENITVRAGHTVRCWLVAEEEAGDAAVAKTGCC
ncbi:ABC transporter ATP-binding protein [Sporomusa malonica]|uniref:Oligopeptide transport system ATP-binding protein n=1 Tax=Sporomusa malonica TaxID=112901 RepID=A0A1W1Y899_9FIRM|nr:ABC transporter ATP-binding protein [Sporomusa malonica]SMC32365.1 oligopeptide transport system ATP-binding protein [Sporomusa malonica]